MIKIITSYEVYMSNLFLDHLEKNTFLYGIAISLVSSIIIVVTALEFADQVQKNWIWLPLTAIIFISLFFWYVNIKTGGDHV